MGENAGVLSDSLCKSCQLSKKFVIGNANMWYVYCIKHGRVLPKMECEDFEAE